MKKSNAKVIIFYVALIAVIFIAVFAMIGQNNKKEERYIYRDKYDKLWVLNQEISENSD